MALDLGRKNALLGSRRKCGKKLGPLADRVLWELADYHDEEGGPVLNRGHELSELMAIPNDEEKVVQLWKLMTKKGVRGWKVLIKVLNLISPETKKILEATYEEGLKKDGGYFSQANTPSDTSPNVVWHESAGVFPRDNPLPKHEAMDMIQNKSTAAYKKTRDEMAMITDTPINDLKNTIRSQEELVGPLESPGIYDQDEDMSRNMPLKSIGMGLKHVLAQELNANKEFVVAVGQELGTPQSILAVCRRTGNPTGFLIGNVQDQTTLDDLLGVLKRLGRKDISDKLLAVH